MIKLKIIINRFFRELKYKVFGFKCKDCYNYNIGDGIDDITKCYSCKNYNTYK